MTRHLLISLKIPLPDDEIEAAPVIILGRKLQDDWQDDLAARHEQDASVDIRTVEMQIINAPIEAPRPPGRPAGSRNRKRKAAGPEVSLMAAGSHPDETE